jgi:predicted ATPase
VAFNGDVVRSLAAELLASAEKRGAIVPLMIGHRVMGASLLYSGDIAQGRAHYDLAMAPYDPMQHRALATRFGVDIEVAVLPHRSLALWVLGYPEAALADTDRALKSAREINQDATLVFALAITSLAVIQCGNYARASTQADELIALADEKSALLWKAWGLLHQGCVLALTGKSSHAAQVFTSGIAAFRSTGTTIFMPWYLSYLARTYAALDFFDDAWRCIGEAMAAVETTKERWCEADVHRSRRNCDDVAGARCRKGGSVFRARAFRRSRAAGKVLGIAGNPSDVPAHHFEQVRA